MAEEVVKGEIHVRIDGALGREDAAWGLELQLEGQTYTEASINWPFVQVGGASRMLDRDQARATALVFDAQEDPTMSNQYKVLEALQGMDCVVMSDSLKAMKAHHVTQLSVEAVEEEEGIRLGLVADPFNKPWQAPEMEAQMAQKNRRRALGRSEAPLRRLYKSADGAQICLSEEALSDAGKAFDLMQRPMSRKEWAERLLQDPTLGMDPNNIDLSAFSERVTELGLFVGQGRLELMKSGNEWLPEIVLHGNAEIPLRMRFETEEELAALRSLVEEAERGGDRVLEVEGVFVSLREAQELVALCERQLQENAPLQEGSGTLVPIVVEDDEADLDLSKQIQLGRLDLEAPPHLMKGIQLRPHQQEGSRGCRTCPGAIGHGCVACR